MGKITNKISTKELIEYCLNCPDIYGSTCIIGDIEASHEEYIQIPLCAVGIITNKMKNRRTNEKSGAPMKEKWRTNEKNEPNNVEWRTKTSTNEDCATEMAQPMRKNGATMVDKGKIVKINGIKLDLLDQDIIRFAADHHHTRSISRKLNHPESTIRRRLNRMEKAELITQIIPIDTKPGNKIKLKCYHISDICATSLIHNDNKPTNNAFTVHNMSFSFPILEGNQPKSSKGQKMTNWTSYIFNFPNHTIRTTTKNIIIFINEDLGAGSIDDLTLKYSQIAQSHAYKFAEKYHIVLGSISKYRNGHFTIEDNALAQIISERGEFKTASGIMIDKSRSSGDLEMKEEDARAMEYTITKLPSIAAGIQTNTKTIQTRLSDITVAIEDIQKWLVLERENRQLLSQNKILEESLERIAKEVDEIKHHIPNTKDITKPGEMYG